VKIVFENYKKLAQTEEKYKKLILSKISNANMPFCWTHLKDLANLQCFTCRGTFSGSRVIAEKNVEQDDIPGELSGTCLSRGSPASVSRVSDGLSTICVISL